jgi:hypothetical protein
MVFMCMYSGTPLQHVGRKSTGRNIRGTLSVFTAYVQLKGKISRSVQPDEADLMGHQHTVSSSEHESNLETVATVLQP